MKKRYCKICYETISRCSHCGIKLGDVGWCSSNGEHYCNEDCQPSFIESKFLEDEVKKDGC